MPLCIQIVDLRPIDTGDLLTILGFTAALIGVFFASRQLAAAQRAFEASQRAVRGDFLLSLADHFKDFDDLHESLLEENRGEDWRPPNGNMSRLVQYMGLFERCKILIDDGVLDPAVFERLYGYRLRNLVNTWFVRETYLLDATRAGGWRDFLGLWKDMDRALWERTGKRPRHPAPATLPEPRTN